MYSRVLLNIYNLLNKILLFRFHYSPEIYISSTALWLWHLIGQLSKEGLIQRHVYDSSSDDDLNVVQLPPSVITCFLMQALQQRHTHTDFLWMHFVFFETISDTTYLWVVQPWLLHSKKVPGFSSMSWLGRLIQHVWLISKLKISRNSSLCVLERWPRSYLWSIFHCCLFHSRLKQPHMYVCVNQQNDRVQTAAQS